MKKKKAAKVKKPVAKKSSNPGIPPSLIPPAKEVASAPKKVAKVKEAPTKSDASSLIGVLQVPSVKQDPKLKAEAQARVNQSVKTEAAMVNRPKPVDDVIDLNKMTAEQQVQLLFNPMSFPAKLGKVVGGDKTPCDAVLPEQKMI